MPGEYGGSPDVFFRGVPMGLRPTKVDENGGKSAVGWQSRGMAEVVTALEMLRP